MDNQQLKILYIMHVDWDWIKQRPQFIAEKLAKYHRVKVLCPKSFYHKSNLAHNDHDGVDAVKYFRRLPFALYRFRLLRKIAGLLLYAYFSLEKKGYTAIWITHPLLWEGLKDRIGNKMKIYYDCMDNTAEFESIKAYPALQKHVETLEKDLVSRSHAVITSAHTLKDMLVTKYGGSPEKIRVINNGISGELVKNSIQNGFSAGGGGKASKQE